jgi:hypothetical protein
MKPVKGGQGPVWAVAPLIIIGGEILLKEPVGKVVKIGLMVIYEVCEVDSSVPGPRRTV